MSPEQRSDVNSGGEFGSGELHLHSGIATTGLMSTRGRVALVYPGILVALFVLLVAGGVSGSSVGILSNSAPDSGFLLGSAQLVRSDELGIHTPDFLGQMISGQGGERMLGVGEHDLSVLGDLPTKEWSIMFRPDDVASAVLPPENALAWHWWLPPLVSAIAFYGLAVLCGLGLGLSTSVSMLITFSPLVEWWHLYAITGPLGYGSAACFSIIKVLHARSRLRAFLWSVASFYWVVAFALVLYPPFQISTLLALVPITGALIAAEVRRQRYSLAHAVTILGAIGLAAGITVGIFMFRHADAISAIRGTIYPGARQSTGGGGSFTQLFSAYFSPVLAHVSPMFAGTNLSEIAAPYLLAAESLVILLVAGWRRTDTISRNVAVASACSLALGLAWHQLPVPSSVGRFFLLTFVPPQRVLPLISISGAFLFAVLVRSQVATRRPRRRLMVGIVVASTSMGLATIEAMRISSILPKLPLPALLAAACVGALAVAALAAAPTRWGVAAVAMLVGIGFLSVNPLYRGTGALEHSDIAQAIRREGIGATWVNYADPAMEAFLAASGASSLSAVNYYPNSDGWRQLLGGLRDETVWNRYVNTRWHPGSSRAQLRLVGEDVAEIRLSPCAPQLTGFGVTHVIARAGTFNASDACLRPIASASWHGSRYVIYARSS